MPALALVERMVISDRSDACTTLSRSAASSSSSGGRASLNTSAHQLSSSRGSSSNASAASSELYSDDSDSDHHAGGMRVGSDFQAEIPDYCLSKPAPNNYEEKALMVWTPNDEIDEDKLNDFLQIACEKYHYNSEQALGVLLWHNYNLECALSDLPNFVPFPDEWSMEDKALFEQAFQFYNKNFQRIHQLLPEKKISSLVKFYYMWKKLKSKNSYLEKQVKRQGGASSNTAANNANSSSSGAIKNEENTTDSTTTTTTNDANTIDSDAEYEPSHHVHAKSCAKECVTCGNRSSTQYYHSKFGLLCRACYDAKRRSGANRTNRANSITEPDSARRAARRGTGGGRNGAIEPSNIAEDDDDEEEEEEELEEEDMDDRDAHCEQNGGDPKMRLLRALPKNVTPLLADRQLLSEIAREREICAKGSILRSIDAEIEETKKRTRQYKQFNVSAKVEIDELQDFPLLNQNNNRIISRWNDCELMLLTHAVRDFGKDFKTIAEILGNKTETQVKNYFAQNFEKFVDVLNEFNEEKGFEPESVPYDEMEESSANGRSGTGARFK